MGNRTFKIHRLLIGVFLGVMLWLEPGVLGGLLYAVSFVVTVLLVLVGTFVFIFVWVFPRDPKPANIVDVPDQGVKR